MGIGSVIGSVIGGGLSLLQGGLGASGAKAAAAQAAQAQLAAAQIQQQMFNEVRGDLSPFRSYGRTALAGLAPMIGIAPGTSPLTAPLTAPFRPTMEQLAATPGYQFALDQGLQAVQNSYAARGLGQSGNALRGAAGFASGLAAQTYQQQFQNYLTQNQQIYNMLAGGVGTGLQAAGLGAQAAGQFGQMIGGNISGAGQSYAGGTAAATGAQMGALSGLYGAFAAPPVGLGNALTSMGQGLGSFFGGYGANDYYRAAANAPYGSYGPAF